ncbi:Sec-independent protein translocase protein TatB [Helicobacter baculiformis]|uniref:Sec-independent protein translocase protein TatB homolog n=1 Tax=Helicobacter baculiformis TaxID=427351 RepID=A0ABV7ZIR6_9HELI|nr:Sec-independent protein translocase protein TatB [Helicobacter baculiformis]
MFGIGFFELVVILVIAIIFLGPEKFPQAMVDLARFFKAVKKTLNDAKETLDQELHIESLKQESLEYKKLFDEGQHKIESTFNKELKDLQQVQDDLRTSIAHANPLDALSAEVQADQSDELPRPKVSLEKTPPKKLDV